MKNTLPKLALNEIYNEKSDAKNITKIIKHNGKVVGYEIANEYDVSKDEAISLARSGKIKNVALAHNKNNYYLKSIPDKNENNNLSSLPVKHK